MRCDQSGAKDPPRGDAGEAGDALVTVSITTYNHAPFIREAVESVLMQETRFPFEIVIGDDCSTDGTRAILDALWRAHPDRIRLVLPAHNLGNGGVRMFARTMERQPARFVAMLDGDDYWTSPRKLQTQVDYMTAHAECALSFHDVLVVYQDGSKPSHRQNDPPPPQPLTAESFARRCYPGSCSPMFRRDVIWPLPAWFPDFPVGDLPLYVMAAERGSVHFLNEVMGAWRHHLGGEWGGRTAANRSLLAAHTCRRLNEVTERRYQHVLVPRIREELYAAVLQFGEDGDLRAAWRAFFLVAREPFQRKPSLQYLVRELVRAHLRAVLGGETGDASPDPPPRTPSGRP